MPEELQESRMPSKKARPHDRSWYAVPCGLLLRRLSEVEACARTAGRNVAEDVYDWIRTAALEMACQVDEPTDEFTVMVMDGTDEYIEKHSRGGAPEGNQNARGNHTGRSGRPRKRRGDED